MPSVKTIITMAKKEETKELKTPGENANKKPVLKHYKMESLSKCEEVVIKSDFGAFKKGQKKRLHKSMIDLLKSKGAL